jgi:hypothetical protein
MRKLSRILFAVATVAILALAFLSPSATVSAAPEVQRVGLVVDYVPNESISIVDKDGVQYDFTIAPDLKILPADRQTMLGVGAYVTIIAPNKVPGGKSIATGIVIHPKAPDGFKILAAPATPLSKDTPTASTEVSNATPVETATETPAGIETATPTPKGSETGTPVVTISAEQAQSIVKSFLEWLASIIRQLSTSSS